MKAKQVKYEEALARQAKHGQLTAAQKLDRLDTRPGKSKRERARIAERESQP